MTDDRNPNDPNLNDPNLNDPNLNELGPDARDLADLRRLRPDVPLRPAIELEPARVRLIEAIGHRPSARDRARRWALPAAASVATAAAAVIVLVVATGSSHRAGPPAGDPGGSLSAPPSVASSAPTSAGHRAPRPRRRAPRARPRRAPTAAAAVAILDDAANRLAAAPDFPAPDPAAFFYRRTTQASYWTSVSGHKPGQINDITTGTMSIPACVNGQVVVSGGGGSCSGTDDTPHYLGDAPTTAAAWGPYLLAFAPGARDNNAEGKIITSVFHDFLAQPHALAALLRYTATSCPGLHTLPVSPVNGEALIGVTCASMTHGSNALAFDATTHAWVGTVPVDYTGPGLQEGTAEIVLATGFVTAIGRTP